MMLKKTILQLTVYVCLVGAVFQNAYASFINGGFEEPDISPDQIQIIDASLVPGWQTTATDNQIEIWSGLLGVTAYEGDQHVELNANQVSTLFQDASGIAAGSIVGFEFAHRGRAGVDTMALTLTDLGIDDLFGTADDTILFTQQYSDGNTTWGFYTGTGIVALGNTVRFSFASISSVGGSSVGNFLDAADFGVGVGALVPEPETLLLFGIAIPSLVKCRRKTTSHS